MRAKTVVVAPELQAKVAPIAEALGFEMLGPETKRRASYRVLTESALDFMLLLEGPVRIDR